MLGRGQEYTHPLPTGGGRKWEGFLPYVPLYHKWRCVATYISFRGIGRAVKNDDFATKMMINGAFYEKHLTPLVSWS